MGLNRGQWKALVESSRGENWAPKYVSLDSFDDLNRTLGSADYQSQLLENKLVESKHMHITHVCTSYTKLVDLLTSHLGRVMGESHGGDEWNLQELISNTEMVGVHNFTEMVGVGSQFHSNGRWLFTRSLKC